MLGEKKAVSNMTPVCLCEKGREGGGYANVGESFLLIVTEAELTKANCSNAGVNPRSERGDSAIDPRQHSKEETSSPSRGPSQRSSRSNLCFNAISGSLSRTLISIVLGKLNVILLPNGRGGDSKEDTLYLILFNLNWKKKQNKSIYTKMSCWQSKHWSWPSINHLLEKVHFCLMPHSHLLQHESYFQKLMLSLICIL